MNKNELEQLVSMAQTPDPRTGRLKTHRELAESFHLHEYTVGNNLRRQGVFRVPQVLGDPLPENEKAFLLAMVLTAYQAEEVNLGGKGDHSYVKIWTESTEPRYKRLLDIVFSGVGVPGRNKLLPSYYLHPKAYNCLLDPINALDEESILESRFTLSPLLFALFGIKLSERRHRLTLRRVEDFQEREALNSVLGRINNGFREHEYLIGSKGRPVRLGSLISRSLGSKAIEVIHAESIRDVLLQEEGVTGLRFNRRLREWDWNGYSISAGSAPGDLEDRVFDVFIEDAQELRVRKELLARQTRELFLATEF